MKIKDILVLFVFLMAKINIRVLIESSGVQNERFGSLGGFVKSSRSLRGQNKVIYLGII
jgi:hypothetical protein